MICSKKQKLCLCQMSFCCQNLTCLMMIVNVYLIWALFDAVFEPDARFASATEVSFLSVSFIKLYFSNRKEQKVILFDLKQERTVELCSYKNSNH